LRCRCRHWRCAARWVLEEAVVVEAEIGSLDDEASHDGRVDEVVDPPEGAVGHDPRKKVGEVPGLDDQREVVGGVDEIGVVEVAAVHVAEGRQGAHVLEKPQRRAAVALGLVETGVCGGTSREVTGLIGVRDPLHDVFGETAVMSDYERHFFEEMHNKFEVMHKIFEVMHNIIDAQHIRCTTYGDEL
jgi:hypothetical protein